MASDTIHAPTTFDNLQRTLNESTCYSLSQMINRPPARIRSTAKALHSDFAGARNSVTTACFLRCRYQLGHFQPARTTQANRRTDTVLTQSGLFRILRLLARSP